MLGRMRRRVEALVRSTFLEPVPRDHRQPDAQFRRRRGVTVVALLLGAGLLGRSLALPPGDPAFYPFTLLVAATWLVGGLLSGPLHLGYLPWRGRLRRPALTGIAIGVLSAGAFLLGGLAVRQIGPLDVLVRDVLGHARGGSAVPITVVTLVNGAAEEVFFRGAVYAAVGARRPVFVSTAIYAVVTVATGNPMLVFAALTLGVVLAALRRASGGILAPVLTHVTWSAMMLFLLEPLFR